MRNVWMIAAIPVCLARALPSPDVPCPERESAALTGAEQSSRATWNDDQAPVRIFGNVYYVGTKGLSAILLQSPDGHILIDGALPESASRIAASLAALGVTLADVKLIVNSHPHFDHAGGLAELQRRSGARVAASPASAAVLRSGRPGPDDPQFGIAETFPPIARVDEVRDGEPVRIGNLAVTPLFTGGQTRGGTTWTWQSCDGARCMTFVYADSLTAVSADGFRFSRNAAYPEAVADFERSFASLERVPCDVLLTPHPGASRLFERLARGLEAEPEGCRDYVRAARAGLAKRLAGEKEDSKPRVAAAPVGASPVGAVVLARLAATTSANPSPQSAAAGPEMLLGSWRSEAVHLHADGTRVVERGSWTCRAILDATFVHCDRIHEGSGDARRVSLQIWSLPAPADGRFEVLTFTAGRSGHIVQRSLGADPPLVLAALVTTRSGATMATRGTWSNANASSLLYRSESEETPGRWRVDFEERLVRVR